MSDFRVKTEIQGEGMTTRVIQDVVSGNARDEFLIPLPALATDTEFELVPGVIGDVKAMFIEADHYYASPVTLKFHADDAAAISLDHFQNWTGQLALLTDGVDKVFLSNPDTTHAVVVKITIIRDAENEGS